MPPGKTATDFPLPDSFPSGLGRLPAGLTVEGATPDGEGRWCEHSGAPSPLPGGASAAKKMGRSLHQHPLPCGAPTRRAMRGTRRPTPYCPLPRRTLGIRANPRPMRISRNSLDHNGEGCAL